MSTNFYSNLENAGLKDVFVEIATNIYENEKAKAEDKSIFEDEESFVEYYTNEIFKQAQEGKSLGTLYKEAGYEGGIYDNLEAICEAADENGNDLFNVEEIETLLKATYEAGTNNDVKEEEEESIQSESLEEVVIQPWGSGEDDCLSRIIQKHVPEIELYSDDYNQYLEELCALNNISDPNVVSGSVLLPKMQYDDEGNILKDEDGNIKFADTKEIKEDQDTETYTRIYETDENGNKITTQVYDKDNNLVKTEHWDGKIITQADYFNENGEKTKTAFYDSDGIITDIEHYNEQRLRTLTEFFDETGNPSHSTNFIYNEQNQNVKTEFFDAEGNLKYSEEYEYDENGLFKLTKLYDEEGNFIGSTDSYRYDDIENPQTIIITDESGFPCEYNRITGELYDIARW